MRRINNSAVNFHKLTRAYQSPIGGPAPFGKRPKAGLVSDTGAHIDSTFTHRARQRTPKKKIVPRRSPSNVNKSKLSEGERRRAELLGPFMKFIKTKGDDHKDFTTIDGMAFPLIASAADSRPNDPLAQDHTTAPVGHDATPITRADKRFFASSFESKGILPVDSHRIRDETNYDHPAYRRQFEGHEQTDEVEGTNSTTTDVIFHRLREYAQQSLGSNEQLPGVGQSTAFGGVDPMVAESTNSMGSAADDDDETGMIAPSTDDDVSRKAFAVSTATAGSETYLRAQGYDASDLVLPSGTSVPSNYYMGGRDGQLTPKTLIDLELQRAEAEAISSGTAAESGALDEDELKLGSADVYVPESVIYKPFSETNHRDRFSPTSTVLPRHEVAKAVNTGVAAYVHHTAADLATRDRRAAAGPALVAEEMTLSKAQGSSMVTPVTGVFGSELDRYESRYMEERKAARKLPTLPPTYSYRPTPAPVDTIETVNIQGTSARTSRSEGDNGVRLSKRSDEVNYSHEPNPHFPDAGDEASASNGDEEPLEARSFSSVPHGSRQMAPEDFERRRFVRPRTRLSESPGQLEFKEPAFARELNNATVNRLSFDQWWGEKAPLAADIEVHRAAEERDAEDQTLYGEDTMDHAMSKGIAFVAAKLAMRYTHQYPKNEMIFDEYITISKIIPTDGTEATVIPYEHRMKIRTGEARRIAKGMGLDLIKVGSIGKQPIESHALCIIADHRYDKRDHIAFEMRKRGMGAPRVKECQEMGFRAAIKPHDVWHKSFRVARILLSKFPVRIWMKDIGSAGAGTASFQHVLSEIKRECLKINAFHTAGRVKMSDDLIEVTLYPPTALSPKNEVVHPSDEELRRLRDHRVLEHEKEVFRDTVLEAARDGKEVSRYMRMLRDGTAWAYKDEGPSLKRLRDLKKTQGWLKKGNKELYAARGDVNINQPFHASSATSIDRVNYPRASNLEQATRGIAALAARAEMDISHMHDQGQTEGNEYTIQRFYYRVAGDALELGQWKESAGMKTNRRKIPAMAPGFATLGVDEVTEISAKNDANFHGQ